MISLRGSSLVAAYGVAFAFLPAVFCISCFDCNSRTDPRCGDPFDPYSIAFVDCSQKSMPHLKNATADRCRKITQKVEGEVRVHRSCGWLDDPTPLGSCFMRSGTYHVLVDFCSCKGDKCNTGATNARTPPWFTSGLLSAFLAAAVAAPRVMLAYSTPSMLSPPPLLH